MVNKVILIGNLGKDPEVKSLESGTSLASFSMATSESYTKDGERQTTTEWHNIVAWGKLADIVGKYLQKGSTVYIEGKIKTRSWDDKDGNKKYATDIIAEKLTMLGKKQDSSQSPKPDTSKQDAVAAEKIRGDQEAQTESDDLPF